MLQNYHNGEWAYKAIEENMGPNYVNCPLSYLDGLSEPESSYAGPWRERVKQYWQDRRKAA